MVGHGVMKRSADFGGQLTPQDLLEQLDSEIWSLKDALFSSSADETPVYLYLHAILAELFTKPPSRSCLVAAAGCTEVPRG